MRKLDKDIWVVETGFRLFGADFGNRMTVIRLDNGDLLLHSPVKIGDRILADVRETGEVAYIVTPNNFHGLFAEAWRAAFPRAKYFTATRSGADDDSACSLHLLGNEPVGDEIAMIKLNGAPKVNEYAFVHRASHTLILTDMAFNIGSGVSFWSKLFFKLNGSYNKFGPSRLTKAMISDPQALNFSIDEILDHEIQRIIVSHGNIVESNTSAVLRNAFNGYISGKPGNAKRRFSYTRCG